MVVVIAAAGDQRQGIGISYRLGHVHMMLRRKMSFSPGEAVLMEKGGAGMLPIRTGPLQTPALLQTVMVYAAVYRGQQADLLHDFGR